MSKLSGREIGFRMVVAGIVLVCGASVAPASVADDMPIAASAVAPRMDAADNARAMIEALKAKVAALDLSDEQKVKLEEIVKAGVVDLEAAKGEPKEMRKALQATREKIAAILTDDQKAKLKESK